MLIWIDPSVLNANFANDLKAAQGITDVFGAAVRGEHYVLADRNTLRAMAANAYLPLATRTTISTILSQFATLGSIKTVVGTRILVTYGKGESVKKTRRPNGKFHCKQLRRSEQKKQHSYPS